MSEPNNLFTPFDPTGVLKNIRDANLDAWSRMMIDVVNTEAYAKATAVMLDAWLSNSAPFRKALESAVTQVVTNLNMPTRDDVITLAERLTNIEMRLDDLDARLEEVLRAAGPKGRSATKTRPGNGEGHS
jgi:hypothetical protein